MSLTIHHFNRNGEKLIDCKNVYEADEKFFQDNNIKVSVEELSGDIIVYGCPYSDESEESEVIVFAGNKPFEDTLSELVISCRKHFGVEK